MSCGPGADERGLANALNAACQCVWLDRQRLRPLLERSAGDAALLESRPGLVADNVVFVAANDAAAMDRTAHLVHAALETEVFAAIARQQTPAVGTRRATAGILGLDFHLGAAVPQLIEINTNPGGLLLNLEFARAVGACCEAVAVPVADMRSGAVNLDELPDRIVAGFEADWRNARGDQPLRTVAIVDDEPEGQYLYPEFQLYQRLFERAGWRTVIADPRALEVSSDGLRVSGEGIDLVYNRLTDFSLTDERHSALRRAYDENRVVLTPDPAGHAHFADKRLLASLRDEALLRAAGLDDGAIDHLRQTIPATEIVRPEHAAELWARRKELFFKPVDGYGSKAAYRGDKLTRRVFEHILAHRYVAQAIAPTSTRRVLNDGVESDLHVDVRNYWQGGVTLLRAARLYRGQTTNFRTPGGGFAPVITLP